MYEKLRKVSSICIKLLRKKKNADRLKTIGYGALYAQYTSQTNLFSKKF